MHLWNKQIIKLQAFDVGIEIKYMINPSHVGVYISFLPIPESLSASRNK